MIAARDDLHRPVVLVAADWAEIRRNVQNRRTILEERAIADRAHLTAALAAGRPRSSRTPPSHCCSLRDHHRPRCCR